MKVKDIKICLENYRERNIPQSVISIDDEGNEVIDYNNPKCYYGKIPNEKVDKNGDFILDESGQKIKNTIDINFFITQKFDDMGLFTDINFEEFKGGTPPSIPNNYNGFMGRLPGVPDDFYYTPLIVSTGETNDNQLNYVKSLRINNDNQPIYIPFLNVSKNKNQIFDGVTNETPDFIEYTIGGGLDTNNATNISFNNITTYGVEYITFKKEFVKTINNKNQTVTYKKTQYKANYGGKNINTIGIYGNYKQEEFLGIVFKPETISEVFINRGIADIFERHCLLSEMRSIDDIDNFRGGYLRT